MSTREAHSWSSDRPLVRRDPKNRDEGGVGSSRPALVLRDGEWSYAGSLNHPLVEIGEEDVASSSIGGNDEVAEISSPM